MDIDLEAVTIRPVGRRRVLRIIVDADGGVSLDDIAEVSREVSARLDAKNAMGDAPYTLEVSSPGVDRPLTEPRHWQRAIGRLVVVALTAQDHHSQRDAPATPAAQQARVIGADHLGVTLEIDGAERTVSYGELGPGRVQVEFGRLADDDSGDLDGPGEYAGDPDEEGPDGH
jgi:ribosome maturation factor RimP